MEQACAEIIKLRKKLEEETEIGFQDRRYASDKWKQLISEKYVALRERDEARQRLCKVVGDNRDMWGEDVAKEYGWDCFKEKNHNA